MEIVTMFCIKQKIKKPVRLYNSVVYNRIVMTEQNADVLI